MRVGMQEFLGRNGQFVGSRALGATLEIPTSIAYKPWNAVRFSAEIVSLDQE